MASERPNIHRATEKNLPKLRYLHPFNEIADDLLPHIGGKGENLVRLCKAGLPVPKGYCLTTDTHKYYRENNRLPDGLIEEIITAKKRLGDKIAIRSSATCEDGQELSMAGVFRSDYVYDDSLIGASLEKIFEQARSEEVAEYLSIHGKSHEDIEMGIVIQELIDPEIAGVIYTAVNGNNLLVQYVDGFGVRLVDGETSGSAVLINSAGTIVESNGFEERPLTADMTTQIMETTTIVASLFPNHPLDIEFAYRNGIYHLLQARKLTTDLGNVELVQTPEDCLNETKNNLKLLVAGEKKELGTSTAIFSDANYSELLPKPTPMDIGTYMHVWGGHDGVPGATQLGRSEMGYRVEDDAIGIIKFIGGRTYFSIGRYAGIYHIGFPESREEYFSTLVNEYLDAIQADPEKGKYPQMGLILQDPSLDDLRVRFGDRAEEYFQIYRTFEEQMSNFASVFISEYYEVRLPDEVEFIEVTQRTDINSMSLNELLSHSNLILEHIRTVSYVDFVKSARLGLYYSQRLQDLLVENMRFTRETAKEMYSRLNQGLDGSAITDANIQIAGAATEEEALAIARKLIGHFNTGEMLEIRHRPLRDNSEALKIYVQGIRATSYTEQFERQKALRLEAQQALLADLPKDQRTLFKKVVQSSQIYMALRETTKYQFTKEYLLLRDTLEALEGELGLDEGDIYFVFPWELAKLISETDSFRHIIRSRRQSFENYQHINLPNVIRESDIDRISLVKDSDIEFTVAEGKFLAEGPTVQGVVLNVDEFENLSDVKELMRTYTEEGIPIILVGTQFNLTHDPLIAVAAGLVIQNAGIVAHGAQRARELGKGAIGGIQSKLLKTGTSVLFDPKTRSITKV